MVTNRKPRRKPRETSAHSILGGDPLPMPSDMTCQATGEPCSNTEWLASCVRALERRINRSVLFGAMIGSGIGSALSKYLSNLF